MVLPEAGILPRPEQHADNAGVFFGEAAGLIHEVEPAATIIERVVADADRTLKATAGSVARPVPRIF